MKRALSWIIGSVLLFGILSAFASTDTTQVKETTSTTTETATIETTQDTLEIADESSDSVVGDELPETITEATEIETVTDTTEYAPNGTYTNSRGNEVPSPYYSDTQPTGASALCRDGTYSFSQSRRGTCSHHGGVAQWL